MLPPSLRLRAPVLWLLLPFMAGLAAAEVFPQLNPNPVTLLLAALGLAGAAIWQACRQGIVGRVLWAGSLAAAALLAGIAYLRWRDPPADWAGSVTLREAVVELEVTLVFPPAPSARNVGGIGVVTDAAAHLRELVGQRVHFTAIRKISVMPERSARYRVRGVLEPVSEAGGFDDHLRNLGVRLRLGRAQIVTETRPPRPFTAWCERTGERLERILQRGLDRHPETASVYLAMMLGEKAVLSAEQRSAFMRSGTFHVFSVSGLHVAAIAAAILGLLTLARLPPRWTMVLGLMILWLYVQITGASAATVRAWLMIAFLFSSRIFRLPGNPLAALALSALVTLLLEPRQLFTSGFQMSYLVVLALIVMGAPLAERWKATWRPFADLPEINWGWWRTGVVLAGRRFLDAFAATWAASVASAPASIGYFGLFSPGALLANLIVVPLASFALFAGVGSLLAGVLEAGPVSVVFNHAAALLIIAMDWLVRTGTQLPGMYFPAQFRADWMPAAAMALTAGLLLLGLGLRWAGNRGGFWLMPTLLALALILGVNFGPRT
jgi:competence protein ComEC